MALEDIKGIKVNSIIIVFIGLFMIIGAIMTYLLIIKNVYGNFKFSEILPTEENIKMVDSKRDKKAALLYSQYTHNILPEGSTWVQDNIDSWENFLKQVKIGYDIIDDIAIETEDLSKYGLLILSGTKALSDRQLIKIKKYIENGGSIFATSGIATYSDEGKWRGWSFFSEVFGLSFTKELEPEEYLTKMHTLRGNLAITAGIPTGYSLNIATWDRPIYAKILDPRTTQVSYWYDFRNEMGLVQEEINKSAGIAFGNFSKGRFVWFGFELNSVIGRNDFQNDEKYWSYFFKLFENSINWLTYMPTAFLRDWPSDYEAASIFTVNVETELNNLNNLYPLIKNKNYPTTFLVTPELAKNNPQVISKLKNHGEIGAIVDVGFLSSLQDTVNKLLTIEEQDNNVRISKSFLEKITKNNIVTLMPKYGYFNENTKRSFVKHNIDCLLTDSLTDRTVPRLEIWDSKPIITISKTARDDYQVIKKYGLTETNFQRYTYQEDVDRILFEGGIYVFKLHTQYQLKPEYISVVPDVLEYIKKNKVWLTSLSEIKKWWKNRGDLEFKYDIRSKRRIAVEVFNPSKNDKNNFVIEIHINKVVKHIEISSDIINTKIPRFHHDKITGILYLYIEDIEPGETRSLLIDFDNVSLF